jgi:hypothetical protein
MVHMNGGLEDAFVADVTRALGEAGVAERWKSAGLNARKLAEHLSVASAGIKHQAKSLAEYRERMQVAIHLVCRPPGR